MGAEVGIWQATLFRWKRQALIDAGVIEGTGKYAASHQVTRPVQQLGQGYWLNVHNLRGCRGIQLRFVPTRHAVQVIRPPSFFGVEHWWSGKAPGSGKRWGLR